MNRYTLYCTEGQTKKALELGAPIKVTKRLAPLVNRKYITDLNNYTATIIPTAEQMILWLDEQKINVHINMCMNGECSWYIVVPDYYVSSVYTCISRKEAILVAIDAALDYLSKKK